MAEDLNDRLPDEIRAKLAELDENAAQRAAGVSADRVAERVLARLRDEPVVEVRRPRPMIVTLRVAAAVALLLIGGVVAKRMLAPAPASNVALQVYVETDSLDSAQRTQVLAVVDSLAQAPNDSVTPSTVLVEDLNTQELEQLLQTLDQENAL